MRRCCLRIAYGSVLLSLTLSEALLATEQADFLGALLTRSAIGYGSGGSIAGAPRNGPQQPPTTSVPEPPMTSLAIAALLVLGIAARRPFSRARALASG
jgi:hypothetical protein